MTVAGTTVAPTLYYTSATQVAALLPSNTPLGTGTITVTYNGQVGSAAPIRVVQNNVGIFTVTSDGQGVGIVTYPDYSLVSATKAANCGGVYTTCGAANPGDTLTVWTTGLGPVSGNETGGAGLGVDMTNVDAKLWLGGILAKIVFKGRGCCVGEDQIAFVVPDNVPTGCAVPLAIQIGDLVSNYAVISIAPKGSRTCTASNTSINGSFVPTLSTNTGPISYGQIGLARKPNITGPGQVTGNTDTGGAFFISFTVPAAIQPFFASYLDDSPPGTCLVYNTPRFPDPGQRLNLLAQLDGGPSIKVTGPNGSQSFAPTGDDITLAPETFLSPGAYTFTTSGGANVGSINAQLTVPTPASPTGLPSGTILTVTRANGVTFNWTGGAAGSIVSIIGQQSADQSGSTGVSFRCYAAANAGSFTVPPSVTLAFGTGAAGWDFKNYSYGTFTATGVNAGSIEVTYDTPIFATMQ